MSSTSPASSWQSVRANLLLFLCSLLLPLLLFEVVLRATTLLDQLDRAAPAYIPRNLRKASNRIDAQGFVTTEGFRANTRVTSMLEKLQSDRGCKVVVLGDSFVWGAGLPPQQRWTSQLEQSIDCTVYPMGQRGWSSLEYLGYYERHLHDLQFDYLLIGVVSNDPHPRGMFRGLGYPKDPLLESNEHTLGHLLGFEPLDELRSSLRTYDFVNQIVKNTLDSRTATRGSLAAPPIVAYGYASWELRLYQDDIYSIWTQALAEFSKLTRHQAGFLLTPTANSPREQRIWTQIAATMTELDATFRNTYPRVDELFAHQPRPRTAWANPGDPHPGAAQMQLYAQQALLLLQDLGYRAAKHQISDSKLESGVQARTR
jgi:hypothetical protein